MSRFSSPAWTDIQNSIKDLDDEAISHIAFLCWVEKVEREQAKLEGSLNEREDSNTTE